MFNKFKNTFKRMCRKIKKWYIKENIVRCSLTPSGGAKYHVNDIVTVIDGIAVLVNPELTKKLSVSDDTGYIKNIRSDNTADIIMILKSTEKLNG